MALGRRRPKQQDLLIATQDLPTAPGHAFYDRLNRLLAEAGSHSYQLYRRADERHDALGLQSRARGGSGEQPGRGGAEPWGAAAEVVRDRGRPGACKGPRRPKQKPDTLEADKALDCAALRQLLRWLGIDPDIPKRGRGESGLGKFRWFIERTLSWFHQFRRLRIRWDRKPVIH